METILRIAVQKSGRLSEKSLQFIEKCGISYSRNKTKLKSKAHNFPLEILFLRDDDIPRYVAAGIADVGIVGENVVAEEEEPVEITLKMGFSKCRLSIAIPQPEAYEGPESLEGKSIATSYPNLLRNYLDSKGVESHIHEISGSVEIAPSIGLAQAVCDIVSTGSTLMSNGLKEAEVIFKSQAVLIQYPKLSEDKSAILKRLLFRANSVLKAKNYRYILMNVPNDAIEKVKDILPGMRSPSILPLAEEGWSSLHSVVQEDDFWGIIENLREVGAEGILVVPIEKMIT
ncbi:MAG: ATP phosphoribosyltransferase [Bacteroidota bacterium]